MMTADLKSGGPRYSLCLATELTPHPTRVPVKCIGNAVHPLPKGEGCQSNEGYRPEDGYYSDEGYDPNFCDLGLNPESCLSNRQSYPRLASLARAAVLKGQRASVRLGDLPAQDESDACTHGLGGEERHKKVRGVWKARSLIFDQ